MGSCQGYWPTEVAICHFLGEGCNSLTFQCQSRKMRHPGHPSSWVGYYNAHTNTLAWHQPPAPKHPQHRTSSIVHFHFPPSLGLFSTLTFYPEFQHTHTSASHCPPGNPFAASPAAAAAPPPCSRAPVWTTDVSYPAHRWLPDSHPSQTFAIAF